MSAEEGEDDEPEYDPSSVEVNVGELVKAQAALDTLKQLASQYRLDINLLLKKAAVALACLCLHL